MIVAAVILKKLVSLADNLQQTVNQNFVFYLIDFDCLKKLIFYRLMLVNTKRHCYIQHYFYKMLLLNNYHIVVCIFFVNCIPLVQILLSFLNEIFLCKKLINIKKNFKYKINNFYFF